MANSFTGNGDLSNYLSIIGSTGGYAVVDTSANVASNIDSLKSNLTYISSITLSDTNPLSITATQLTSAATVLNKIVSNYTLAVSGVSVANIRTVLADTHVATVSLSDSSANIASNLDILQSNVSKISSIIQTGTVATLAITATQLSSDTLVLAKISGVSLAVSGVSLSLIHI